MFQANSCASSHETNGRERLYNSFSRRYCSIQGCLRNITSLYVYCLIFVSKSPLCRRKMTSVLLRVLHLQRYASDCGSLWDHHYGPQPWSRWPQDHHCLSFMAPLGLTVFSVASVLRLGQSHILLEFLLLQSSCTIISSIGSFLFPQQSCQEVVLRHLFLPQFSFPCTRPECSRQGGWNF